MSKHFTREIAPSVLVLVVVVEWLETLKRHKDRPSKEEPVPGPGVSCYKEGMEAKGF